MSVDSFVGDDAADGDEDVVLQRKVVGQFHHQKIMAVADERRRCPWKQRKTKLWVYEDESHYLAHPAIQLNIVHSKWPYHIIYPLPEQPKQQQ